MKKYLFIIVLLVSCAKIDFPWNPGTLEEVLVENNKLIMIDFYAIW